MKPTDEQFAQINAIEQECFHGSWTSDTLLSELNSPLNILVTEERGGIVAGFAPVSYTHLTLPTSDLV